MLGVAAGSTEPVITGSALIGFAVGWLLLAVLSTKYSDQPQQWAFVPAAYFGVLGLVFLLFRPGNGFITNFGWVWPITLVILTVWMFRTSKKHLHSRTRQWLIYPILLVLAISALGGAYETVQERVDKHNIGMRGQLVDVGGYRMHLDCIGSGSPTVVLEPGLGEPSSAMTGWIAPAVAHDTRVCTYDRAGRGWSDASPTVQDGKQTATALHTLLQNANEKGPFVLAGHSAGGAYVQNFSELYPADVAGLVLLDSMSPYQYSKLPGWPAFYSGFRRVGALLPSLSRIGIGRLAYGSAYADQPATARDEQRTFWASPALQRSQRNEFATLRTALEQAQALKTLGDKPVYVLTAVKEAQAGWLPLQKDLKGLSSNSVQELVPGATHSSLVADKKYAAHSNHAITTVVSSVRESRNIRNTLVKN